MGLKNYLTTKKKKEREAAAVTVATRAKNEKEGRREMRSEGNQKPNLETALQSELWVQL